MGTRTDIKLEERINPGDEASKFALNAGMGLAALIGIWGFACLIGGLTAHGFGGLLRGFWTALTGN